MMTYKLILLASLAVLLAGCTTSKEVRSDQFAITIRPVPGKPDHYALKATLSSSASRSRPDFSSEYEHNVSEVIAVLDGGPATETTPILRDGSREHYSSLEVSTSNNMKTAVFEVRVKWDGTSTATKGTMTLE